MPEVAVKVCRADELRPGDVRVVVLDEREVAVFNVDGSFHAMDNTCPHRGAPLSDGRLEGRTVLCPWHGWQFDVTTGALALSPETRLGTYPVEERGGVLYLRRGAARGAA